MERMSIQLSYCVNCGVKLTPSQGKCPLCGAIVHNPLEPYDPKCPKEFPTRTKEQNLTINKRYLVLLIAVVLGAPAVICLLLDFVVGADVSWSLYPAGGLVLIGVGIIVPTVLNRHQVYYSIVLDGAALCLYLWMVERISPSPGWFFPIAFPIILLTDLMVAATVGSIRQKTLRGLMIPAVILLETAVLALAVELLCESVSRHALRLLWSPFVLIPCGLVALVLFLIQANQPLREELQRRLHI